MENRTLKSPESMNFIPELKDIYDVLKPILSTDKILDDKELFLRTIRFHLDLNDCQYEELSSLYTHLRDIYEKDYLQFFLAQHREPTDFLIMDDRNFILLVKSTFSNENTKLRLKVNDEKMQQLCKIFLDVHLVSKREIVPKHIFHLIDAYERFHQKVHHDQVVIYKNLQKAVIDLIREYKETKSQEVSLLFEDYKKYLKEEKEYQEEIIMNKHSFHREQGTEMNYDKIVITPGQLKCLESQIQVDEGCDDERKKQKTDDDDYSYPSFLKPGGDDDNFTYHSYLDPKFLKDEGATLKKQQIQKDDDVNDDLSACTLPSFYDDNDQKKNP